VTADQSASGWPTDDNCSQKIDDNDCVIGGRGHTFGIAMVKQAALLISLLGALSLAACAHGEEPEGDEGADAVKSPTAGDKGSRCGGGEALKCKDGFECRTSVGDVPTGNAFGTCVAKAGDGEFNGRCGGPDKIECTAGVCKADNGATPAGDAFGTCIMSSNGGPSAGDEGSICGGLAAIQCKKGLTCKSTTGGRVEGDSAGTCK